MGDDDREAGSPQEIACEFYTPKEVAKILSLSKDMVYDMLREGKMPAIKLGTGKRQTWRIPKKDFEIYLKSIRSGPSYHDQRRAELRAKLVEMQRRPELDEPLNKHRGA